MSVTILGVAGVAVGWVIADWLARVMFGGEGFTFYVRLGILSLGFGYILEVPLVYLQVTKRSQAFAVVAVLRLATGIALNVLFVVFLRTGVLGTLYAEVLGNALFCIVLAAMTVARVGPGVSARLLRVLVQYGAPSLVIAVSSLAIANVGRIMLTRYGSLADVGLYSLAEQIAGVMLLVLVQPFATAWVPPSSRWRPGRASRTSSRSCSASSPRSSSSVASPCRSSRKTSCGWRPGSLLAGGRDRPRARTVLHPVRPAFAAEQRHPHLQADGLLGRDHDGVGRGQRGAQPRPDTGLQGHGRSRGPPRQHDHGDRRDLRRRPADPADRVPPAARSGPSPAPWSSTSCRGRSRPTSPSSRSS